MSGKADKPGKKLWESRGKKNEGRSLKREKLTND